MPTSTLRPALFALAAIVCSSCAYCAEEFGAQAAKLGSFKLESRAKTSGKAQWSGTGFFVAGHALAVTNNHVATDAAYRSDQTDLVAIFPDGTEAPAQVAYADMALDLAALELRLPTKSKPLVLRKAPPRLGERIAGAGYGQGLEFSLAEGLVAALAADGDLHARIQVSAATDAGVSGGPTLDANGLAIGANVAGAGRSIAFSIPASDIEAFLAEAEKLKASGGSWSALSPEKVALEYSKQYAAASAKTLSALLSSGTRQRLGPWNVLSPAPASGWHCSDGSFELRDSTPKPWHSRHDGFSCYRRSTPMSAGPLSFGQNWTYSASRFEPRASKTFEAWSSWIAESLQDSFAAAAGATSCSNSAVSAKNFKGHARTCLEPARDMSGLWNGSQTTWLHEPSGNSLLARIEFEGLDEKELSRLSQWLPRHSNDTQEGNK